MIEKVVIVDNHSEYHLSIYLEFYPDFKVFQSLGKYAKRTVKFVKKN